MLLQAPLLWTTFETLAQLAFQTTNMAASKHRSNSRAVPAPTTPSAAQATPVANPPHHPPSSSAQPQPSNRAQQTASSGARTRGQVTGTPAPPAPASTTRELRPRPVPQASSGRAPATTFGSGNAAASHRKSVSKKNQTSRHRTANANRVTNTVPRRTAGKSRDGPLKAGTAHGRSGDTPTASGRRGWNAPSSPSQHDMLTRSRGRVTRTYQQMEAEVERANRRVNYRRRARRREREEEREYGRSREGTAGKRARVQQVMNPRN